MGKKREGIELLARAAIFKRGRVLIVRRRGAANTFLPGGHIEWLEPARAALRRELMEETGRDLCAGRFLGCIEHAFGPGSKRTHEINLLFSVSASGLPERVVSREPKLHFFWQPLGKLGAVDLQPQVLQRLLPRLAIRKRPAWGGTME